VLLFELRKWLIELDAQGSAIAFPEYPWPAVALLELPLRLDVPTAVHYYVSIILFVLAIDALFAWLLWRSAGGRMSRGLALWLALFPALGPLMVTRYDILPAVLAGSALLALAAARPATAGVLASLGAGFKIWPALGFAALLVPGEAKSRARLLAGIGITLLALVLASWAAAGWGRLWSPFSLQGKRGLQLEAFAALPFLWARYLNPDGGWTVRREDVLCKCHELYGPGVDVALQLTFPALLVAAALAAVLYVRAFRAPAAARTSAVVALLTAVSLIAWLVTARVFSPQYMIWLAAPLAVLGTLPGTPLARRDVALFVAAAILTHLIYPLGYEAAIIDRHPLQALFLVIATLRDALIVWLGARLALQTWRLT
jgi:hypothetical protein